MFTSSPELTNTKVNIYALVTKGSLLFQALQVQMLLLLFLKKKLYYGQTEDTSFKQKNNSLRVGNSKK
jgi:hypothetical protein